MCAILSPGRLTLFNTIFLGTAIRLLRLYSLHALLEMVLVRGAFGGVSAFYLSLGFSVSIGRRSKKANSSMCVIAGSEKLGCGN